MERRQALRQALGRLVSRTLAFGFVCGQTTESLTRDQCDARPAVRAYLPSLRASPPLGRTKLYCMVTEAHGCEQLTQIRCPVMDQLGIEPATTRSQAQRPNHYTTWVAQKCSGSQGVGLVIERSRVRLPAGALLGSLGQLKSSIPRGQVNRVPAYWLG